MEVPLLQPAKDEFQRIQHVNMAAAAAVALHRSGELSPEGCIAAGVAITAAGAHYEDDPARWSKVGGYLEIEALSNAAGCAVTELHPGRSRQDIVAITLRMAWRRAILDDLREVGAVRRALQALASRHPYAVLPLYAWGVPAQPSAIGHYLLGFSQELARWQQRMHLA